MKYAIAGLLSYYALQTMNAQEWTGAANSDWNNPANWSEWPLSGENITIDPMNYTGVGASAEIISTSMFTPDRMLVMNGASLAISANLTVADRFIISDDAQVTMTAGTLVTDRLIMELGGAFTLDAGTVNTGRLVLGDDGQMASLFVQNGGTVTVSSEFGFDCAVGPSTPLIELNAGMLTVNTDGTWLGVSPSSGQGRFLVNGGTAQINGSLVNSLGSSIDMLVLVTGGSLGVNGPLIDLVHATDSLRMIGGTCTLDGNLVFRNDGVVHADAGLIQVMGQAELRGVGTFHFNDVSIVTGAVLEHTDPAEIEVAGNWTNAGIFVGDVNTVAFVGSVLQTIEATDFFGVRVDNGSGVTLSGPSSVSDLLSLENGLVNTTDTDLLTVLSNGTSTSGTLNSYVNGPLRKVGNSDFNFPIGKGSSWRRIGISSIDDQDTEYTAAYFDQGYSNTTALTQGLSAVSTTEYWTLSRAVTTDDARVKLFWEDAAASGITNCDPLVVAQWNGMAWEGGSSTTSGSCAGTDAGGVELDNEATSLTAFTFGTQDASIGIDEVERVAELLPYPQPSDSWATVPCNTPIAVLSVLDQAGRIVNVQVDRTSEGVRLHTSVIPAGVYMILINDANGLVARARLVVVH